MALETATFVTGVGVLVSLDLVSLAAIFQLGREMGRDDAARERAQAAEERAQEARAIARDAMGAVRAEVEEVEEA